MKRNGFTLIEAMVLVAALCGVVGLGGMILYPLYTKVSENRGRQSCQNNGYALGLTVRQYNQDYDEKFPLVKVKNVTSSTAPFKTPYGWADAIQPYLRSTQVFQCPSEADGRVVQDATQSGFTDYFYNSNLSGKREKDVKSSFVILFGEGNDGIDKTDARYNRNYLPASWLRDKSKPSFRHLDGANYIFTDGHIKWYMPSSIDQPKRPDGDAPSFKVR